MDEPTKGLVLRLMQEDVKDTLELYKGKRRISQMTDRELALTEWAQELHHYASDLQDCRMARSVARAVLNDGVAIEAAIAEENRDFGDRMIALQLDGLDQSTPAQLLGQANATMAGLTGLMGGPSTVSKDLGPAGFPKVPTSELVENKFPTAESSRHAATRKSESQPHFECVACLEVKPFFDILTAPCSHHYCKACTDRLVRDSFVDESLFPPRCCRMPIPLPTLQAFLTKVSIRRFEEKEMEHNDFNRTYCANPLCSRYILPNPVLLAIRTCPSCNMATCTTCKRQAHTVLQLKMEEISDPHSKRFRGQYSRFMSSAAVSMMAVGEDVKESICAIYATTCFPHSFYNASIAGLRYAYAADIIVSDLYSTKKYFRTRQVPMCDLIRIEQTDVESG
ncbi:hypothetical protein ETB97_002540 [Aspergillus alliaceus]|uniref:IBR domain-containing protein n=1 Tax=Petromyces alliaceus TaxID=209559 RepID=A0A8H6A3Y5_PETAA|nr:hypothetical protein ETB97_002540 [Aspergillus burnettii]